MKIGLVVNDINTEKAKYTTTLLAKTASNMGHEVSYISIENLSYSAKGEVYANAATIAAGKHNSLLAFCRILQKASESKRTITLDELDVLWLRNDPAEDVNHRPWARLAGLNFGRLAMRHGVLVVNDPRGLNEAINKMYLQYFPETVRPRAIITRDPTDIKHFVGLEGGYAVLKPLSGSGGHNVFLISPDNKLNTNQIIESVSQDGFVIVQEYLKAAKNGDTRLFLLNGKPLTAGNKIAAIHRVRVDGEDMRSNVTAGAKVLKAQVTPKMLELAEIVRPKLTHDGMFFVGLDIVAEKLMEINVFSPGGLHACENIENGKFSREIIRSLERKIELIKSYNYRFDNAEMATL
jgi:glutathione synthase